MKTIRLDMDNETNTVHMSFELTDREMKAFNISRFKTVDDLKKDPLTLLDVDAIIRSVFRVMEFPIEMYDYITNSHAAGKAAKLVEVRRACMWALRKYGHFSLMKIGKLFDLTHATVIHHINKMDGWLEAGDPQTVRLAKDIEWELEDKLNKD